MSWSQTLTDVAFGFAVGFWFAAELGRIIYNRKMDELRGKIQETRDSLNRSA